MPSSREPSSSVPAHLGASSTAIGLQLPSGVREAVERSASLRRGLALLHRAPAEAVATALGVHPRAVDEARERLDRPDERRLLLGLYAEAARRRQEGPAAAGAPPPRRGPRDLVAEAERHPLGVAFLRDAHAESVAVTFTVHPETVHRARELLAAAGRGVPRGDEA